MSQINRWKKAQEAEESHHQDISSFGIESYFKNKFSVSAKDAIENKDIIEVGCGTGGMVYSIGNYINDSSKVLGIDPIVSNLGNVDLSTYPVVGAAGENIPSRSGSFDVAVSTNVLDHVLSPYEYLCEINRVLRSSGDLFLKVNVFERPEFVRNIFDRFDNEHPHHFKPSEVLELLRKSKFKINYKHCDGIQISDRDISNWSLKWVLAHTIGGFDTMYVRASPK